MALLYNKTFDELLAQILTDYSNLDSNPDISQGSMPFVQGSVLASMVFGLFRYNDYNAKQMFVDTADHENLLKHGAILDIPFLDSDTDSSYLDKILRYLRQAPAGGNKQDFEDWALDQDNSFYVDNDITYYNAYANVVKAADGAGTVGVYTIPNDETIIDGVEPAVFPGNIEELLRIATETYILVKQPLGIVSTAIVSSKPQPENVTMFVTAGGSGAVDTDAIKQALDDFMTLLAPGESLLKVDLACIAKTFGAKNATMTIPSGDITPDKDKHIRPGTITVTEV